MRHEGISEAALHNLVEHFYGQVRADPLIGPLFNETIGDWPEHLAKLQSFWSSVMLTSGRYKGRPLPAHLKHADRINAHAFQRWLSLWKESTDALFDPPSAAALQDKAARIAESLALGIQFNRHPQTVLARSGAAS
jgi:hemoglobin